MDDPRSHQMNLKQTSLGQKIDIFAGFCSYPALTVLMFIRRRVGYRTIRPYQLIVMFVLMRAVPTLFFNTHCSIGNGGCAYTSGNELSPGYNYFTYAFLIFGFVQRWIRWRELASGKAWHSYSRGISYLEFLSRIPLPIPGLRRIPITFIYRMLDGLAVVLIAMLIGGIPALHGLAQWLFFAAFCMLFVENYVYDKQLDRELDVLDSLVEGEVHSRLAERYAGVQRGQASAPGLKETDGIPTGIGPDIIRVVEARRKPSAPVPDNLATGN